MEYAAPTTASGWMVLSVKPTSGQEGRTVRYVKVLAYHSSQRTPKQGAPGRRTTLVADLFEARPVREARLAKFSESEMQEIVDLVARLSNG